MRPKKGELFYGNPQGLTPPTTNIAKRRFIPTKSKLAAFHKKEVSRCAGSFDNIISQ
jgi:hypothetical protein